MMKLNQKGLIQWIALLILAVALPAVLYLAQKTQIFKPRAFDVNPPSAEITSPANNTTVSIGNSVSIAANASDSGSDIRGMEIFRARTTADLHSGASFMHVAGSATSGCSGGSCSVSGSWTPQAADEGDWYIVVNAYSGSGNCSGNPGFLPDGWSNCGTKDSVVVHVSGGTTIRATIVVAGESQGGAGIDSTAYPDQTINFQAQAESTGADLSTLSINVTDQQQSAKSIAQKSCSGNTCEVTGSLTWSSLPRQPSGTDKILYYVYVEAKTTDNVSCSGRGNPAAGTADCSPGSNFTTLPSSHLTYYLQVKPVLTSKKYRKGEGLRISTNTQGFSGAFVNCVEDPKGEYDSFYACAASYKIFCCRSGCQPIQNQFTGTNDACWLSPAGANSNLDTTFNSCGPVTCAPGAGQYSQGTAVYPAGTTTGGVYQSTVSTYTSGGSVMYECRNRSFVAVPISSCNLPNYCVVVPAGGQLFQCWIDDCKSPNPTGQCATGSVSCPTGQTNPHRVFSGGSCIGIPGCGVPECNFGDKQQIPTPPTYACNPQTKSCSQTTGGITGAYTDINLCNAACSAGSLPPTTGTRPAKFKVANFEGSGQPTVAQCDGALASAGFQTWTSTTTVQDNISHTLRNVVGTPQYVCAQFYDANNNSLGSAFWAPIIYKPSESSPEPSASPVAGCTCQSDNSCSTQCSFEKHAGLTTYASPIRCAPTTATYNTTPTQANKDDYCRRTLRTKGDADGNRLIGNSDRGNTNYGYYLRAVLGQPLPPVANPDFSGDGEVGTADLDIWRRSRQ